jgi:serine/threonine protein kinase
MAPEQLSGEGADGRSDLFSLGVILYAMVTGHSPFPGSSAATVCFKVVNREPVPASAFDLDLPRGLDAVIARAMAKDPNSRYQRGSEFAADLQQLQQQHQLASTTTSLNPILRAETLSSQTASSAPANRARAAGERRIYNAILEAPLRGLILGAALMLMLVLFLGNPFEKLARRPVAGAQTGPPSSPNRLGAENTDGAQPMPWVGAQSAAIASAYSAVPALKAPADNFTVKSPRNLVKTSSTFSDRHPVPTASLELAVQHQFKEATLSLWIDDKLTLTEPLHGSTRKHLIVFNGVHGANSETVKVPSGAHVLRLRAQSTDQSIDLSKTISVAFTGGDSRTLLVTFNNHNTAMNLIWK